MLDGILDWISDYGDGIEINAELTALKNDH
jgi:hypothetical protein